MNKPFTLGITGGSGSGKTFFLRGLAAHFKPEEICLISQDNYYKPIEQQVVDENGVENFDLPGSIDRETFQADILKLMDGQNVLKREHTFNNPQAKPKMLEFKAAPILVVEGLFVQYFDGSGYTQTRQYEKTIAGSKQLINQVFLPIRIHPPNFPIFIEPEQNLKRLRKPGVVANVLKCRTYVRYFTVKVVRSTPIPRIVMDFQPFGNFVFI